MQRPNLSVVRPGNLPPPMLPGDVDLSDLPAVMLDVEWITKGRFRARASAAVHAGDDHAAGLGVMRTVALPEMAVDVDAKRLLTAHLTLKERGAYDLLLFHYWRWGRLPAGDHQLAAIRTVHPRSWQIMKASLSLLFEPDEDGLWRDYDLEQERVAALRKSAVRGATGP